MITRAGFLITGLMMSWAVSALENDLNKHITACKANSCTLKAAGAIDFSKTSGKFNAKNIFMNMRSKMEGELRLYHSHAKFKDAVKGVFIFDNTSDQTLNIQYKVLFKDKKGAIAQTTGHIHLKEGKRQKAHFSEINLSAQDIKNINSYDIQLKTITATKK